MTEEGQATANRDWFRVIVAILAAIWVGMQVIDHVQLWRNEHEVMLAKKRVVELEHAEHEADCVSNALHGAPCD